MYREYSAFLIFSIWSDDKSGLTSKAGEEHALICVKTAIKRYENSSSQCVFRTDSASEKACGFLSFRFKNTKLFRLKAENGIFRHLCGKKRNKSGGGKTFSEFLGIKPSQCLWPSFQMVLTGIGNYAYRRKDGVCVVPIGCLKH